MQRILLAAVLGASLAGAMAPASAQIAGSISIGQPGFYGRLDLGGVPAPELLFPQPVVIAPQPVYGNAPPLYLRVPPQQARHWRRYCAQYGACGQQVYFVRDDWYSRVYVPAYREHHGGPPPRGDDARQWRPGFDGPRDRHGERGHDRGPEGDGRGRDGPGRERGDFDHGRP